MSGNLKMIAFWKAPITFTCMEFPHWLRCDRSVRVEGAGRPLLNWHVAPLQAEECASKIGNPIDVMSSEHVIHLLFASTQTLPTLLVMVTDCMPMVVVWSRNT